MQLYDANRHASYLLRLIASDVHSSSSSGMRARTLYYQRESYRARIGCGKR